MNQEEIATLLDRFESFDGAYIRGVEVDFPTRTAQVTLDAFDARAADTVEGGDPTWSSVVLGLTGLREFRLAEGPDRSWVQLDDRLEVITLDGGHLPYLRSAPGQRLRQERVGPRTGEELDVVHRRHGDLVQVEPHGGSLTRRDVRCR